MTLDFTKIKHVFNTVEYLPEFIKQYVFHTKYKADPNYLVFIFAYDNNMVDKDLDVEKTVEKYGSMYNYLNEKNLYDGESTLIYDFIKWLPEEYFIREIDNEKGRIFFNIYITSYNHEEADN